MTTAGTLLTNRDETDATGASRAALRRAHRPAERDRVRELAAAATFDDAAAGRIREHSRQLILHLRSERRRVGGIDALMSEYDLSSAEGVTLMCLAEALLRIPDAATQSAFIEEMLGAADWHSHLGASEVFFVNASTFGLMLAGRVVGHEPDPGEALRGLLKRLGAPVVRQAARRAMRILGGQFVLGETIDAALQRSEERESEGYRFSYDMLGEAARTAADAEHYCDRYLEAIHAIAARGRGGDPLAGPGISVKLSALHPRFEFAQRDRLHAQLQDRLVALGEAAATRGVGLCIDAEEADRLEPTLDLFEALVRHLGRRYPDGIGLAVQAYQKRAPAVIDWLTELAGRAGTRLQVRLVKGAYWDTEIKLAQQRGVADFPVYTRKAHTDISYLACASRLFAASELYPCLATHNAGTLASLVELAGARRPFEFQRLHGMGEALYQKLLADDPQLRCRIYAPVGGHEELLAYLVRRLLENGANSSFVNRLADDSLPIEALLTDPVSRARADDFRPHPGIRRPPELFAPERRNSRGWDLADPAELQPLKRALERADARTAAGGWHAAPVVAGTALSGTAQPLYSPADRTVQLGQCVTASPAVALQALGLAAAAAASWADTPVEQRARRLRQAADLLEQEAAVFVTLLVREAGRCVADAHLEVREAVDFLRYYAVQAEQLQAAPLELPGPTGESNRLYHAARGPFLCISPWNFPLAIFTGQIAAALAVGCPVLAKPAEQTPLVAARMVDCLHRAGVPGDVLHFLPGDGARIAEPLLGDSRLGGVAFTGSTATARRIAQRLAERTGPIIPLIAETGGINAMIVDSTALPEQVTRDVLASAFQSAGQRCSALRLLCLQRDIADHQLQMIAGAMAELRLGDPGLLATDVGPIIDAEALARLVDYRDSMRGRHPLIAETPRGSAVPDGFYFAPVAFELDSVADLQQEVFGPVLHVVRWDAADLDALVDQINGLGYGLTLGLHSRSSERCEAVRRRARVGNLYVNRNQIGAVVGVQPFGGEGLSGTGPKAGGPGYPVAFTVERTVTVDTTAAGGNASLLAMEP